MNFSTFIYVFIFSFKKLLKFLPNKVFVENVKKIFKRSYIQKFWHLRHELAFNKISYLRLYVELCFSKIKIKNSISIIKYGIK